MPSVYPCDNEDGNTAAFTVSNQVTGDTLFVCPLCFSMMGTAMLKEMYPEVWAETTAPPAPEPKARAKRGAKPATTEPDESARTVAEIVESGPRMVDGEAVVGETMDGRPITQPTDDEPTVRPDASDPAPY